MVCLDAFTNRARPVNPLFPTTDDEKALYKMGESLYPCYVYVEAILKA